MKMVLIYAGTTEGRRLAEELAVRGIASDVCVATEYGRQVMSEVENTELIRVRQGRLLPEKMKALLEAGDYLAVVDATHPFATAVTENVKLSMQGSSVPYVRLSRELKGDVPEGANVTYYDNAGQCAAALGNFEGNVLLTTGSKELALFCRDGELRKRLIVRVLPGRESMEACWEHGLEGRQIVAMQGPFTKEMNLAIIRQYHVAALVTKESGKVGGTMEKVEAALEAGIPCHVIRPPVEPGEAGASFDEAYRTVLRLAGVDGEEKGAPVRAEAEGAPGRTDVSAEGSGCEAELDVVLAGIGMGSEDTWTVSLKKRLEETDYVFGARRMLQGIKAKKEIFPHYLEKDVIPCLEQIRKTNRTRQRVTILLSGDTGFYSGAEKLYFALQGMENVKVTIYPGISTISALGAKFGLCWQDCAIISTHGTDKTAWKAEMLYFCRRGRKIFFLTSGAEDVREIGALLEKYGLGARYGVKLGYQLSYAEEACMELVPKDLGGVNEPGLYAGFLIPVEGALGQVTPGWSDELFLRDKVPMTKEEIREISLCKLRPAETAVIYDVGSGTGSIAMEAAALSPKIRVYAIECNPDAVALIKQNQEKFGACNVSVVEGMAPEAMKELPPPTHVFIGGSKGNLREILEEVRAKNPRARVVMNAISLESIAQMQMLCEELPTEDLEVTTVNVSKAKEVGSYHLMQAGNPVTIFSFTFCEA